MLKGDINAMHKMEWSPEELLERLEAHDECQRIEAKTAQKSLENSALDVTYFTDLNLSC